MRGGSRGLIGCGEEVILAVGLELKKGFVLPMADGEEGSYRPISKAGDARGESSVAIVKTPSNFLSG